MNFPTRKPTRLSNYDYSTPGFYFITICSHNKQLLFGAIKKAVDAVPAQMQFSPIGQIVYNEIQEIENHYTNVKVLKFVVMPNHVHIILQIQLPVSSYGTDKSVPYSISSVVGQMKAASSRKSRHQRLLSENQQLWQKSFHDHIIRGESDYLKIWKYIDENPSKWALDCFYPSE